MVLSSFLSYSFKISTKSWKPPWSASLRGWSGDGTARGTAWCCRHFCHTASRSQRSRGSLPGQLLSEVGQETEQLVGQHGVVVIFVIQLQDLNEVVEASLVLGVLAGLVHGEYVGLGEHLLALLGGSSDLGDGLEGGVQVAGADEVAGVEGVNLAISLEVIDIE